MKTITHYKTISLLIAVSLLPCFAAAQGISIGSGSSIVSNGNINLVIRDGSFINNGNFSPATGSLIFTGSSSTTQSAIGGSAASNFYNLVLNKSANGIQLGKSISVSALLDLQSGDSVYLNGFNIDFGSTGSVNGEVNSRRITGRTGGYIQSTINLNAPASVNPGNMGLVISSSSDLGLTQIRRYNQQQGGKSIFRFFDIAPANNTNLNATLQFYYFHIELGSIAEGNLAYFQSANSGVNWVNQGEDGINLVLDYVTKTGMNQLNRFTLSDISLPLYVHLLYFKVKPEKYGNQLDWASASENDNDYYELQRSVNGITFSGIGRINANNHSSSVQTYQFHDNAAQQGLLFYRLEMTDRSGVRTYSDIVMVSPDNIPEQMIKAWPNPAVSALNLSITLNTAGIIPIRIQDLSGQTVRKVSAPLNAGKNEITIDISKLPRGIYQLTLPGTHLPATKIVNL